VLYQLSYVHHRKTRLLPTRLPRVAPPDKECFGTPGRTRTCDPRLRRPLLYPAELRAPCTVLLRLVGVEGFEPPTSCSQSRCATRLRYTPRFGNALTRNYETRDDTGRLYFRQTTLFPK
jgi:hypothetical protein